MRKHPFGANLFILYLLRRIKACRGSKNCNDLRFSEMQNPYWSGNTDSEKMYSRHWGSFQFKSSVGVSHR